MNIHDETRQQERIRECMERLAARYKYARWRMRIFTVADARHEKALCIWFEDRMNYLQEVYRETINEEFNIGRQYIYDSRPKLD